MKAASPPPRRRRATSQAVTGGCSMKPPWTLPRDPHVRRSPRRRTAAGTWSCWRNDVDPLRPVDRSVRPGVVRRPVAVHRGPPARSGARGGAAVSSVRAPYRRYLCEGFRSRSVVRGGLWAAGVGQGGAPAAKRGRMTLTDPRAGADLVVGPVGGGVGAPCVT
jgi:hypothetical protein